MSNIRSQKRDLKRSERGRCPVASYRVSSAWPIPVTADMLDDSSQRDGGHIGRRRDKRRSLETVQAVYLLKWKVMRRVLILGLALSVIAAGVVPLSACALFSSKMAECAEARAQSPCDQMRPHSSEAQSFKDANKSCCVISQAPLPELQFKAMAVGPAITIEVSQQILAVPSATPYNSVLFIANSSPPSSQSLLCTFLI